MYFAMHTLNAGKICCYFNNYFIVVFVKFYVYIYMNTYTYILSITSIGSILTRVSKISRNCHQIEFILNTTLQVNSCQKCLTK